MQIVSWGTRVKKAENKRNEQSITLEKGKKPRVRHNMYSRTKNEAKLYISKVRSFMPISFQKCLNVPFLMSSTFSVILWKIRFFSEFRSRKWQNLGIERDLVPMSCALVSEEGRATARDPINPLQIKDCNPLGPSARLFRLLTYHE